MRKLGAALLIYLGLVCAAPAENTVGPSNAVLCNKVANVAVGPSSVTQVVAGVAGQSIFVCGYQITNTGATGTYSFSYGTGTTCTTPTTMVTTQSITSTAPATYNVGVAQMQAAAGASLCVTPSAATIATTVWYSQF
jgi:hypothetical protein